MSRYAKFMVAAIGGALTLFFDQYGAQLGLPADWPESATAVLTPVIVYLWPNKEA